MGKKWLLGIFSLLFISQILKPANLVQLGQEKKDNLEYYWLDNGQIKIMVVIDENKISYDNFILNPAQTDPSTKPCRELKTNAGFNLEVMWTGWRSPGKQNNGDNPVTLTKDDFTVKKIEPWQSPDGQEGSISLYLTGAENELEVLIIYRLRAQDFFGKRQVGVRDPLHNQHLLQQISPSSFKIMNKGVSIIKKGDFGQPVVIAFNQGGAFFGLEYPASTNMSEKDAHGLANIECRQFIGEKIGQQWINSDWTVYALTPDHYLKHWFFRYLESLKVAPARPYTLYNSWYDLRAADYPSKEPVAENNVMNEKNIFRMINLIRANMVDKHGIKLDAFVLDDGWDVYESDWQLRPNQFPHGLKPIAEELARMNTSLGIWFGPTGGYSSRSKRINWMKNHGYEVVGDEKTSHNAMLCLAGKTYSQLFKQRTSDFVKNEGVAYFKWDGIQFSCSEPDHGHPTGIYSQRAVLDSLIEKCQVVRSINPNTYLNITSGTWLSPWWVKYANQIWMDGEDYGYADIPSISQRDSAMTYRDSVLYVDFKVKDLWFPMAHLMTHGIIKGNLEKLGGEEEPIDKFTNEVLLYFARGVSMWELYISPDLLTEDEWHAISQSIKWAKERFDILASSHMIGGDPLKGVAYGYVHFNGQRGLVALRNPVIDPQKIQVELSPEYGLSPQSYSLVWERIYPNRWISPKLYSAGATIDVDLNGFETAIYEVYPLDSASVPLLAGVIFEENIDPSGNYQIDYTQVTDSPKLLNPEKVKEIVIDKESVALSELQIHDTPLLTEIISKPFKGKNRKNQISLAGAIDISKNSAAGTLALLLTHQQNQENDPEVKVYVNGRPVQGKTEKEKGRWLWLNIPVSIGKYDLKMEISLNSQSKQWQGHASLWFIGSEQPPSVREIIFKCSQKPILRCQPPLPHPSHQIQQQLKLFDTQLKLKSLW